MHWHTKTIDQVISELNTSLSDGLTQKDAAFRLLNNGLNELTDKGSNTIWKMLLNQFKDFMILVLIVASIVSGVIGEISDTIIILIIVLLNATIGFIQEYRAEKVMESLKKMTRFQTQVIRDRTFFNMAASQLVTGDLVLLEQGNMVPADIRLTEVYGLMVDEASLTGESIPVEKQNEEIDEFDLALGDRLNMAFKGSLVTSGHAKGVVVATGMNTEIGRIAGLLQMEDSQTPLQHRLAKFGKRLTFLVLGICIILYGMGILRGEEPLEMLLVAIAIAVAAIPEALPAVVTISLALGAKRLSKKNILTKKLPAVETLGSVTYICTDKTGTLTESKMTVVDVLSYSNEKRDGTSMLDLCMALNHDGNLNEKNIWVADPTELSMLNYISQQLSLKRVKAIIDKFHRLLEISFDSKRKRMTTVHPVNGHYLIICKGAAESISELITHKEDKKKLLTEAREMADQGKRVIAYAYKVVDELPPSNDMALIEDQLKLCGLVGLQDPPRDGIHEAIEDCRKAGIQPVMITGDHRSTASAIGLKIGLLDKGKKVIGVETLHAMTREQLENTVETTAIYARVSPEDKLRIVQALQAKHHFVAMTGDGVNDAPALRKANIGIAMGITGTDVSKEAADMILMDDNFVTIVGAIREGRRIFDNILKFIKYTMTSNSGEIWTIVLAPLVGLPMPLQAVHILWINLVTDGLPGLAFAVEPEEKHIMNIPPRSPKERIFSGGMGRHILFMGLLIGLICVGVQAWSHFDNDMDIVRMQTMVFTVLSLSQLGHALAVRSNRELIYRKGIFTNKALAGAILITVVLQMLVIYHPFMNELFKTKPLTIAELTICILSSSIVFHVVELSKWFGRKT